MEDKDMLQTKDLAVGYDHRIVIDGIGFTVKAGEILVLIGPNGAGKSTILKTLAGQLGAIAGQIYLDGSDIKSLGSDRIAKTMSLLMTERPHAELMTVEDMVETGRYPYTGRFGILGESDHRIVDEALAMVELCDVREREFDRISDGQKQRAMLARAICQEPGLMILDEPTSYLDMHHKLELLFLLKELVRKKDLAVVMSLHELDLAQKCADQLICVREGKVDRCGSSEEIFGGDGDYIRRLYDMEKGTFLPWFGSLELERPTADPMIFVIGGGGAGIPVYRRLQRQGKAFVAGVLQENDLEWPVAQALAVDVITVPAFEAVDEAALEKAFRQIDRCQRVVEAVSVYGSMNRANQRLVEYAKEQNKLAAAGDI